MKPPVQRPQDKLFLRRFIMRECPMDGTTCGDTRVTAALGALSGSCKFQQHARDVVVLGSAADEQVQVGHEAVE